MVVTVSSVPLACFQHGRPLCLGTWLPVLWLPVLEYLRHILTGAPVIATPVSPNEPPAMQVLYGESLLKLGRREEALAVSSYRQALTLSFWVRFMIACGLPPPRGSFDSLLVMHCIVHRRPHGEQSSWIQTAVRGAVRALWIC